MKKRKRENGESEGKEQSEHPGENRRAGGEGLRGGRAPAVRAGGEGHRFRATKPLELDTALATTGNDLVNLVFFPIQQQELNG